MLLLRGLAAAAEVRLCSISELDPVARTLVEVAAFSRDGVEPDEIGKVYSLDDYPATLRVLTDREPLFVRVDDPNADAAEKQLLQEIGEGVLLALPIISSDRAIGLIELYDKQPREFSANVSSGIANPGEPGWSRIRKCALIRARLRGARSSCRDT